LERRPRGNQKMTPTVCLAALVLLLLLLVGLSQWTRGAARPCDRAPAGPRALAGPIVLISTDARQRQAALAAAAWPDGVRFLPSSLASPAGAPHVDRRLALYVASELELFRCWDRTALAEAQRGHLVSHGLRRQLRALARPQRTSPPPRLDPRLLLGEAGLVQAARLLCEPDAPAAAASADRIARWLQASGLSPGAAETELAFLPGSPQE